MSCPRRPLLDCSSSCVDFIFCSRMRTYFCVFFAFIIFVFFFFLFFTSICAHFCQFCFPVFLSRSYVTFYFNTGLGSSFFFFVFFLALFYKTKTTKIVVFVDHFFFFCCRCLSFFPYFLFVSFFFLAKVFNLKHLPEQNNFFFFFVKIKIFLFLFLFCLFENYYQKYFILFSRARFSYKNSYFLRLTGYLAKPV